MDPTLSSIHVKAKGTPTLTIGGGNKDMRNKSLLGPSPPVNISIGLVFRKIHFWIFLFEMTSKNSLGGRGGGYIMLLGSDMIDV